MPIDSGMVEEIKKAREYSNQPHRIEFLQFEVRFDGINDGHTVTHKSGEWKCDCRYFQGHGICSHTLALERILGVMVSAKELAATESVSKVRESTMSFRWAGSPPSELSNSPDEAQADQMSGIEFLLAIAGQATSGQHDVSERTDEILTDEVDPDGGWKK